MNNPPNAVDDLFNEDEDEDEDEVEVEVEETKTEAVVAAESVRAKIRRAKPEVGWLVELPGTLWWTGDSWSSDSLQAIRFARREDAEKLIRIMRLKRDIWLGAHATEHQWGG